MNLNADVSLPEYYPAVQDVVPGAAGKQGGVMNTTLDFFPAYMDWPDAQAAGCSTQPGESFFTLTHGAATSEPCDALYDALSTTMPYVHPH